MSFPADKKIKLEIIDDDSNVVENGTVEVEWQDIKNCRTVSDMLSALGDGDDTDMELAVPLPQNNVKNIGLLNKVCEFSQFMRTDEWPTDERKEDSPIENELTNWEKKFVEDVDTSTLQELILLANYLNFSYMLESLCCGIAGLLKDKSTEEIRQQFGIKNDFTPEEEEKVKKENSFIEEALKADGQ
tara:strand:+ start:13151 stop:13711 length:561 start_codon:yes stop_codon:yes gene_type:complete